jgi:hypothetical protein
MQPENKTQPTTASVKQYIDAIEDTERRKDAKRFNKLAQEVTGEKPVMWGTGIVGFGTHHYKYASGREGDIANIGFAARKNALVVYGVMDSEENVTKLAKLGPHGRGKGCLYIKDFTEIHTGVLKEMVSAAYKKRSK